MSVADKLETLLVIKDSIKDAIIEKGVDVSNDDAFTTYPEKILQIEGGNNGWFLQNGYWSNKIRYDGVRRCGLIHNSTIGHVTKGPITYYCASQGLGRLIVTGLGQEYTLYSPNASLIAFNPSNDEEYTVFFYSFPSYLSPIEQLNTAEIFVLAKAYEDIQNLIIVDDSSKIYLYDLSDDIYGTYKYDGFFYYDLMQYGLASLSSCRKMFEGSDLRHLIQFPNTSSVTDMYGMFQNTYFLESINLTDWDLSNVINMSNMFMSTRLRYIDLSNWYTPKLQDAVSMFSNSSLEYINVSGWDVSSVLDTYNMFGATNCTTLDLSNFNAINCKNMSSMFRSNQQLLTLNLTNFRTDSVENMDSMFYDCWQLTELDISSFNTSNVTNMNGMFQECTRLKQIIGIENLDVRKVTNMSEMFMDCIDWTANYTLDLSNWKTDSLTNIYAMFMHCRANHIKFGGNLDKVMTIQYAFYDNDSIESITLLGKAPQCSIPAETFGGKTDTGILYFNGDYDYSTLIAALPSGWTAVAI